ncbi:2-aminomuconate deaminase, partial [Blyttiomyces helicus]
SIKAILAAGGATLENVVDLTVFLVDMKDYAGFNAVYNQYFDAATGPSRTTVAVHQLPNPRLLIEIKAVAAVSK